MYLDGIEYIYIEREKMEDDCLRDGGEGEWIERQ